MEAGTLIRKIYMDCPLCDKVHDVEERKRMTTITLKGVEVAYEEKFYFCANANEDENEFETGAMTNRNLLNARNAYRIKMGLPISNEINIIYNGMSLQNNRRVRRSIILPGIAKYRTDILRQCLVKCVSEF